jgi:hypothetical protein
MASFIVYVLLDIYFFQKARFDRLQNFQEIEPINIAFHKLCSAWIDQAPISWPSPYYTSLGCLTVNTIVASYISFLNHREMHAPFDIARNASRLHDDQVENYLIGKRS